MDSIVEENGNSASSGNVNDVDVTAAAVVAAAAAAAAAATGGQQQQQQQQTQNQQSTTATANTNNASGATTVLYPQGLAQHGVQVSGGQADPLAANRLLLLLANC